MKLNSMEYYYFLPSIVESLASILLISHTFFEFEKFLQDKYSKYL